MAVMKFGIGRWTALFKSQVLPTKNISLCYLQLQRIMGQQSLAGFVGLHVDLDRIASDNAEIKGYRKTGFLVNQGDKLTPPQKLALQLENQEIYGLSKEYIEYLKLPKACDVAVYNIDKIVSSRRNLTTIERINHLGTMKSALNNKYAKLKKGIKIHDFEYMSPGQFDHKMQMDGVEGTDDLEGHMDVLNYKKNHVEARQGSSIDEDESKPKPKFLPRKRPIISSQDLNDQNEVKKIKIADQEKLAKKPNHFGPQKSNLSSPNQKMKKKDKKKKDEQSRSSNKVFDTQRVANKINLSKKRTYLKRNNDSYEDEETKPRASIDEQHVVKRRTRGQAKRDREVTGEEVEAQKYMEEELLNRLEGEKAQLQKTLEKELDRISSKQKEIKKVNKRQKFTIEVPKSILQNDDSGSQVMTGTKIQTTKPNMKKRLEYSGSDNDIVAKLPLADSETEISYN